LRLDTKLSFTSPSSWAFFDLTTIDVGLAGFGGAVCLSNAVLLSPVYSEVVYHNRHVRYDTTKDFTSASSYSWNISSVLLGYSNPPGLISPCKQGNFVLSTTFRS